MTDIAEKYINPFTDGDSLKYYRDLNTTFHTIYEEGMEKGFEKVAINAIKKEYQLTKSLNLRD